MSDFVLSCCSTVDLTPEFLDRRRIVFVCFHFEIDGVQYPDDMGKSIPFPEFYRRMAEGQMTHTSQVSVGEYTAHFEKFLKEGKDVLHLCLSSGISGTYNSAKIAADELSEQYPERKLYVLDSLCASTGYGLLMDRLADLRDEGHSIDEVRDWALSNRLTCCHWFTTTDLTYLIRGGRVSKTAGAIGQFLNICPIMFVDRKGGLAVRHKVRGKKHALQEILKHVEAEAKDGKDYSGKIFIVHSACMDDAQTLKGLIEAAFPKLSAPVQIFDIGTTIGSHTGPGTFAAFFWGEHERTD